MQDDMGLVNSCLAGEQSGWISLRKIIESILAETEFFLSSPAVEQEDLIQESLLAVINQNMRALQEFKGNSSLRTYLRTIVRRVAIKIFQRERQYMERQVSDIARSEGESKGGDLLEVIAIRHLIQTQLSPMDQRILYLVTLGHTSEEIADILTRIEHRPISPTQVRQRKSRAVRRLRRLLSHS